MLARNPNPISRPYPFMPPRDREPSAAISPPSGEAHLRSALARQYGCSDPQVLTSRLGEDQAVHITRKFHHADHFGRVEAPASADAYLLCANLGAGSQQMVTRGRGLGRQVFAADTIGLRPLAEDHAAEVLTPFDFLFIHLPRAGLAEIADDLGRQRLVDLACPAGEADPVAVNLARALLPALNRPRETNALFVDYLVATIGAHLIERYGDLRPISDGKGGLARWQQMRAEEFMLSSGSDPIRLSRIADECRLSPSYFARAFKQTYGVTPHQWLCRMRVEKAKTMLLDPDLSIADIALDCGFADQSHLTRVFHRQAGAPPARWRRQYRL
ncbi:AraC family transcriptional regulator [Caulobacter sp. UNC279MFTsu5.1]|uniref:helix-turn-helix transcriptional regulator n=1 Tax=Caulobacter sp. UNC279MFTsu5.1 TaxID=1502775 RepID=UPI0008F145AB|nr:AraC family transcriptional regulator [Caulobacter sp. UNC279MFTsu5.1]SFJ94965.1 Helix-turn-helix domain-containing protein [Caulobacter sp. UNC279MFTsu5.1]